MPFTLLKTLELLMICSRSLDVRNNPGGKPKFSFYPIPIVLSVHLVLFSLSPRLSSKMSPITRRCAACQNPENSKWRKAGCAKASVNATLHIYPHTHRS